MKTTKLILTGIMAVLLCTTSCKKQIDTTSEPELENLKKSQEGEWKSAYYLGSLISYQRINGQNILNGDMILTDDQLSASPQKTDVQTEGHGQNNVWPAATIYYYISTNFTTSERSVITSAINDWANKTGLSFVSRNTGTYLSIQRGSANNCTVGYVSNATMNLSDPSAKGIVVHELGHAIGLHHEQLRADRDTYIDVKWSNISTSAQGSYNKITGMNYGGTTFDFASIMLYGSYNGYGAINGSLPTTTRKDGTTWVDPSWSGSKTPSTGDVNWVKTMYGL
jgi:hypothetical protein